MKILKRFLLLTVIVSVVYLFSYAWRAAPILTGYGAKMLCSCAFLAGRDANDIRNIELARFPVSLGSFQLNTEDSSATGSVLGLARKKAVFRKGLGCTLISEISEHALRKQTHLLFTPAPSDPDSIPWPKGDKLADSLPKGLDAKRLHEIVSDAFSDPDHLNLRNTRAIVVLYDGIIIAEQYAEGFNAMSRLQGWSMAKSLTNALVGILVKQGRLNVHDQASVDSWKHDDRKKITLNDLMHASSGLAWVEEYGGPSDATNMLFKKKDMGLFAAQHPMNDPPGSTFYYSSGTANLISWIIRQTVGDTAYYAFPYKELFSKIGAVSVVLEPDAGGTFVGSSYAVATARDWARFGLLYLNDGVMNGEQILPDGWVSYTRTPAPATKRGQYGAQFWLNAGAPGNPKRRSFPDVPPDLFYADGFAGQDVFILPSKKLVVVKLSESQGDFLDDDRFLADIISTLPQ
jgi:CubicO group peptidase (beta-lactamase class C family)